MNIHIKFITDEIKSLAGDIKKINESIKKADESSTNLTKAFNKLTLWLVIIALAGFIFSVIQFLHKNQLWLFTQ